MHECRPQNSTMNKQTHFKQDDCMLVSIWWRVHVAKLKVQEIVSCYA